MTRIDELFDQSLTPHVPEPWILLNHKELSKIKKNFSKLMIAEICDIIHQQTYEFNKKSEKMKVSDFQNIVSKIEKHFEVKK